MKKRMRISISSVVLLFVALLFVNFAYAVQYEIINLGTLGGTESIAYGINDSGQIVGESNLHSFLYTSGTGIIDIASHGDAYKINNSGQILYRSTCCGTKSTASDINSSGQIVGNTLIGMYGNAFVRTNGSMNYLGTLPGDLESIAYGINDSGQIVGVSYGSSDGAHAFLYQSSSGMINIGTLSGANSSYHDTVAQAINNSGQITGWSNGQAFLYTSGSGMLGLGTLGGTDSTGFDINNAEQVVGFYTIGGKNRAFLYSGGVMSDLGTLPGDNSSIAYGINNSGQIVGLSGKQNGTINAVLWNPLGTPPVVPEPISSILFVTGGALLAGRRYIRKRTI